MLTKVVNSDNFDNFFVERLQKPKIVNKTTLQHFSIQLHFVYFFSMNLHKYNIHLNAYIHIFSIQCYITCLLFSEQVYPGPTVTIL